MIVYLIYDAINLTTLYADQYGNTFDTPPPDSTIVEAPPLDEAMSNVRKHRNALLYACDWTQLPDAPLTPTQKSQWLTYRQQLRDLPASMTWNTTKWPDTPTVQEYIPDIVSINE